MIRREFSVLAFGAALIAMTAAVGFAGAQPPSQSAAVARPTFEVATLKQVPDDGQPAPLGIFPSRRGDRFTWCTFLTSMLSYAYNIPGTRIEGFHDDAHGYTVTAKIDPSATEDQARQMLQALLVEKMQMAAHRETREMQGYVLVVAKNGPKLKEGGASGDPPPMPDDMKGFPVTTAKGRIFTHIPERGVLAALGRGVSIGQLADELSKDLKTPVVDKTGLAGKYYFELKFQMPDVQMAANQGDFEPAADISSALPDQLGLRLEKQKVPAEFLVVEHFEQPTGN